MRFKQKRKSGSKMNLGIQIVIFIVGLLIVILFMRGMVKFMRLPAGGPAQETQDIPVKVE